ncbi:MAG: C4-dicarboxylic acid transporter DauA [bacterium]|nr:C4-dicarboxylic acid transporter DauA [bacterium]
MSTQRSHLFSLRIGHALRETLADGSYKTDKMVSDALAGLTVGIIAIPLAMALAIASGVAPQYGLYTAIIAGFVIALTGGSRFSVSGPTAAFVVILHPVASHYGLGGLLIASVLSGVILVGMAWFRLGRLIEYIPESVTLGFTGGIAVVIATLQVKDFLGLNIDKMPEHYLGKVGVLIAHLPETHLPSLIVSLVTFSVMFAWPLLKSRIPAHLPAVVLGTVVALLLNYLGSDVATIGSRFSYLNPDGSTGHGIPPFLPSFVWPWLQPGADGSPVVWDLTAMQSILASSFAIAMLGAVESLLCAVVLDSMTGTKHSANSELLGQGIGNILTPFFGGITATAAIARSAANVRAGAFSPFAAMIHAVVVLAGLVLLAPLLSYLPMPAMAALLVVVAWNMSEAHKSVHLVKISPRSDIMVLLACLVLTIVFDMVIAITAGVVLASLLFVKEVAEMTKVTDITENKRLISASIPDGWRVFRINGPLFFAAAERVTSELALVVESSRGIVLQMDGVSILDAGGLSALNRLISLCQRRGTQVFLSELQFQPLRTMAKAGVVPVPGYTSFHASLEDALNNIPLNK